MRREPFVIIIAHRCCRFVYDLRTVINKLILIENGTSHVPQVNEYKCVPAIQCQFNTSLKFAATKLWSLTISLPCY